MDLNAFPDTVLRAVFDRVPLSDLVRHIPLVCHRWHSLQPSVLSDKKNVAVTIVVGPVDLDGQYVIRKSNIIILFGDQLTNEDGTRMYPSPADHPRRSLSLRLSNLSSERVDALIGKFDGNVTYLDMYFNKIPEIANLSIGASVAIPLIISLLDHWAHCLKTLKLHCAFTDEKLENLRVHIQVAVHLGRLIMAVNKLPVLEHLTLDLYEHLLIVKPLDLPILSRLKEFYFYSDDSKSNLLFKSLKRYAEPNGQLRAIGLGNVGKMRKYLDKFTKSSLAARFTMLSCVGLPILLGDHSSVHERQLFLDTFRNLTKLTIGLKGLNLPGFTTILSQLHSLIQLGLISVEPFSKFDSDPVEAIRPLPSVKILDINAITSSHKDLNSPHWARMLPNMQIVLLLHTTPGCSICGFTDDEFEGEHFGEKVTPCVRRTLLSFKQQFRRTLKKVYYYRNDEENKLKTLTKVFTPDDIELNCE